MAKGDFVLFASAKLDLGKKIHDLTADQFKFAVIKSAANGGIDPTKLLSDPRWGAGGGTDLSLSEVVVAGNYLAGGVVVAGVTWALTGADPMFDSTDVNIGIDAANPTNGRWAIIYNNTAVGKQALGYIDFGGDLDLTQDDLDYAVDAANGYFKIV